MFFFFLIEVFYLIDHSGKHYQIITDFSNIKCVQIFFSQGGTSLVHNLYSYFISQAHTECYQVSIN